MFARCPAEFIHASWISAARAEVAVPQAMFSPSDQPSPGRT